MPAVLYDMTELLRAPARSGIQRVVHEIAHHWPAGGELVPACLGGDGRLHALSPRVFRQLGVFFGKQAGDGGSAARKLRDLAASGRPLSDADLGAFAAVLNAEVFFCPGRVALYESLLHLLGPEKIFFVVYDMLPWLHPEWFSQGAVVGTMPYLRLLRQVMNLSFISRQARDDFLTRALREQRPVGPVLPLGADGLGRLAPNFQTGNRRFAVLGTLEPRKNHVAVIEAFERLWDEGAEAELVFLGRLGWLGEEALARVEAARRRPGFTWVAETGDEMILRVVRGCRATIYPSLGEGYGLPPVESLALGKPVIVTDGLPCTEAIPPAGQVRLARPDAQHIYHAVRRLLDDQEARRLYEEIHSLVLPTWAGLSRQVREWAHKVTAALPAA